MSLHGHFLENYDELVVDISYLITCVSCGTTARVYIDFLPHAPSELLSFLPKNWAYKFNNEYFCPKCSKSWENIIEDD